MLSNDYEATLKEDIEVIESKRQLLEQLVAVTQAIEQMQESLQAVLILGASSKEISEHALNFYNRTSNSFKNLPVTKLQEYHQNLDAVIRSQLKSILHFSDITCCSSEAVEVLHIAYGEENENPLLMIEEFKRTAQTAVSLKILLRKRGVPTAGTVLPMLKEKISEQLKLLQQREQEQRGKIMSVVKEMHDDVERMIANPAYPKGMQAMLMDVREKLEKDIKSLEAGLPLDKLSFVIESHELTALQDRSEQTENDAPPAAIETKEMSFSEAADRWLNSSWDVAWKDIKSGKND